MALNAYFCTVDENWNSAYPYAVGPTFYGVATNLSVDAISEDVTVYDGSTGMAEMKSDVKIDIFPNPASDLIAVQVDALVLENLMVELFDLNGKTGRFKSDLKRKYHCLF